MCPWLHMVLALLAVSAGNAAPNYGKAMQFGYPSDSYGPEDTTLDPEESPIVIEGLISSQRRVGLKPSGNLDSETLEWMERSRSGLPDNEWKSGLSRRKRGVSDSKWNTTNLTYRVSQYPTSLSKAEVDQALAEALQMWSNVSALKFTMLPQGPVHIDVKFVKGAHGPPCDQFPFDGPGGTTSHAYNPEDSSRGIVHFDDDETWKMGSEGTNLIQVAVWSFGIALGLRNSEVNGSAMNGKIGYNPHFTLHPDDIKSVQQLYGNTKTQTRPPTGPETVTRPAVPGIPNGHSPVPDTPGGRPADPGTQGGRPPVPGTPNGLPLVPGTPGGRPPVLGTPGGRPTVPRTPDGRPTVPSTPGGRPAVSSTPDGCPPVLGDPAGNSPVSAPSVPRPINETVINAVDDILADNDGENIYNHMVKNTEPIIIYDKKPQILSNGGFGEVDTD